MTSSNLNYLPEGPHPNNITRGLGLQLRDLVAGWGSTRSVQTEAVVSGPNFCFLLGQVSWVTIWKVWGVVEGEDRQ